MTYPPVEEAAMRRAIETYEDCLWSPIHTCPDDQEVIVLSEAGLMVIAVIPHDQQYKLTHWRPLPKPPKP